MSSSAFPKLLSPVQVGSVPLRNRVVMSALTRDRSAPTNVPNDVGGFLFLLHATHLLTVCHQVNLKYYTQRAEGGAGLIVTEGTLIVAQG